MGLRMVSSEERRPPRDPAEVLDELREAHLRAANLLPGDNPWQDACVGIASDLRCQLRIYETEGSA